MIRILLIASLFAASSSFPAPADAAGRTVARKTRRRSLMSWFRHFKHALERSAVESRYRRGTRMTAVAAVRGAGQESEDPTKPYWKGTFSSKKSAQRMKEREELAEAVELVLEGYLDAAKQRLDAFEAAHPTSGLLSDVEEARVKIREVRAAQEAPMEAAADKPAEKSSGDE